MVTFHVANIVIEIYGGNIIAVGNRGAGIGSGSCDNQRDFAGTIKILGGNITASSGYNDIATIGGGYRSTGGTIIISGGNITANGRIGFAQGSTGNNTNITLGWTEGTDRIYAGSYTGTVTLGKGFLLSDTGAEATTGNIAGKTLVPAATVTLGSISHGTVALGGGAASGSLFAVGSTVTLNVTPAAGYDVESVSYNGTEIEPDNGVYSFTMPAADVTVSATFSFDPTHFSQSGDTYTIHTATGWGYFCDLINEGETFSGKTVKLDANIEVSRMAGSGDDPFCGNFNGGGNTLTFTATDNYCAPFARVKGGSTAATATTISNLNVVTTITAADYRHTAGLIALQWGHVNITGCNADVTISSTVGTSNPNDLYPAALVSQASKENGGMLTITGCTSTGTISTDGKYAAGLVGIVQGTASITDCVSSVTINSSVSGDGTHGGIVATNATTNGTSISIEGCVFDGKMLTVGTTGSTGNCGGFVGWRNTTVTITNSLYAPATLGTGETEVIAGTSNPSATFCRNGDGVTVEAVSPIGSPVENGTYTVSGIKAYAKGITRGGTFYYGSEDEVSLTLSNTATGTPTGYQYGYTASAGTLDGSETALGSYDQDKWYFVGTSFSHTGRIECHGNVHIILCDGKTMNVDGGSSAALWCSPGNFYFYGQSGQTGTLNTIGRISANGTAADEGTITINGGIINATGDYGIDGYNLVAINGGIVTATGNDGDGIWSNGTITLGWSNMIDHIYANSYNGSISVKSGQALVDDDGNILSGDLTATAVDGKTLSPAAAAVTFAPEGYATYYNGKNDAILPAGVKARIVTADNGGTLTYATIADGDTDNNVVPAGTAIMLQTAASTEAQTKALTLKAKSAAYTGTNLLHGSDTETTTTGSGKHYKLSYNTTGTDIGWYWETADGAAFETAAHKAWIVLPNANARSFIGLPGGDSESTGITTTDLTDYTDSDAWYTIDGRKLSGMPTKAGLYIVNGKKIVIK